MILIPPFLAEILPGILRVSAIVTVIALVFLFLCPNLIVSEIMYIMHLKRTKKEKWARECSCDDPTHVRMYNEGKEWISQFADKKVDVHIVNEGLNLYGEFYDLGATKTAILVSGRTEALEYSYYFSRPYILAGCNVLFIDQRAHGLSDGEYNTIGFEEHKDLIAWIEYLQKNHHTEAVYLHGCCIGASCCLFALTAQNKPDCVRGFVAEGMYPNFYESFKNHMIELKKPVFPGMAMINMMMVLHTGHSMKNGPIEVIDELTTPILMLHGTADLYSLPEKAECLYDKCGSENKNIIWFENGEHSLLRPLDSEKYDSAIITFIQEVEERERISA
ncbi:MAG: alpha/beta hydrolase [Ruminococcaceae bacterium]|nr:alpha/beta hydrolase [Oscillospiraceae bacterium]